MGMFGAGKAYSMNFARTSFTPRTAVPQHGGYHRYCPDPGPRAPIFEGGQQTVIEYKNNGGGFWGFLGGFLGAFDLGGAIQAFGDGGGGGIAAPPTTNVNYLQNLRTLGPQWRVVDNGDGTFSAARDGYRSITGTYAEVKDHIINQIPSETPVS